MPNISGRNSSKSVSAHQHQAEQKNEIKTGGNAKVDGIQQLVTFSVLLIIEVAYRTNIYLPTLMSFEDPVMRETEAPEEGRQKNKLQNIKVESPRIFPKFLWLFKIN